jgi:hypothetical protein
MQDEAKQKNYRLRAADIRRLNQIMEILEVTQVDAVRMSIRYYHAALKNKAAAPTHEK